MGIRLTEKGLAAHLAKQGKLDSGAYSAKKPRVDSFTGKEVHDSVCPLLAASLTMVGAPEFRWAEHPLGEYRFHPVRKWQLDFYFPCFNVAIEVEGGISSHRKHRKLSADGKEYWVQSRHLTEAGFTEDAHKYFEAGLCGIMVLRVSPAMVKDGRATSMALRALRKNGWEPANKTQAYTAYYGILDSYGH